MRRIFLAGVLVIIMGGQFCLADTPAALEKASELISNHQYDAAIAILEQYIPANPQSAQGYFLMAQAYHWKKELYKARVYYFKAAETDGQYRLSVVPLLDELNEWENIVNIVEPELRAGNQVGPSALGALATAYRHLKQNKKSAKLIEYLGKTKYDDQDDEDYKNYILAYANLWNGDTAAAKEKLKLIRNRGYLQYARTHEKFKALFQDPEFLEMTK
jgi:predicted Zn-dependent protease